MKISSVIKMAFMTLILGVSFTACGNKNNATDKKLVKMTSELVSKNMNFSMSKTFSYYTDGRLKEVAYNSILSGDTITRTFNYVWDTDSINITAVSSHSSYPASQRKPLKYTMNISDQLVRSLIYEEYPTDNISYNYDASNRIQHTTDGSNNIGIVWDNDKLISITQKSERYETDSKFTYGESLPIKGYLPLVPNEFAVDPLFVAHPELGGMKTTKIFVSKTYIWSGAPDTTGTTHYEYELDKDGYITKITAAYKSNKNDSSESVYTFIWE